MTQSQASLMDQLAALIPLANKAGLYDAADYLELKVNGIRQRSMLNTRMCEACTKDPDPRGWSACGNCRNLNGF